MINKYRKPLSKHGELEAIKKWLLDLHESSKKYPIIVEGKKDAATLLKFGIGTVQLHRPGVPLHETIEKLAESRECILLFDLDKAGKKIYERVKEGLKQHKVRVNSTFRNFLFAKTNLRVIEGLDTYIENLEKEYLKNHNKNKKSHSQ